MDQQVEEDAAGPRDVVLGGRRGIVSRGPDDEQLPERARSDRIVRCPVPDVEAALKADLDQNPGALDIGDHVVDRRELERNGFLAEGGQAGRSGKTEQRRVSGRRGRDHERVDAGFDECLGRFRHRGPELSRDLRGARRVDVGERKRGDASERAEGLSVKGAHPANADDPNVERRHHASGYSKWLQRVLQVGSASRERGVAWSWQRDRSAP